MEQEETLCDEVETERKSTYLCGKVSFGGGCKAVVTARTRCGWIKLRECGKLLYGRRYSLKLLSILIMWLECWFLDTEVDGSNPSISMLCP